MPLVGLCQVQWASEAREAIVVQCGSAVVRALVSPDPCAVFGLGKAGTKQLPEVNVEEALQAASVSIAVVLGIAVFRWCVLGGASQYIYVACLIRLPGKC